jgi:transcriptional regulator with XRE-family HTH domain
METVGTNIKNAMTNAGIKQEALKSKTGIDQHRISNILNDKQKSPSLAELESIAKALDCSVVDLLPASLVIQNNTYHEDSSSVQNFHYTDPKFIKDLINQIVELKIENKALKSDKSNS